MTQYIDKDALVVEIEKRYKYWREKEFKSHSIESEIRMSECQHLMLLLNTLEVKEVDLEEAARKYEDKVYLEKGWQDEYGTHHAPFSEIGNAFREGGKFILKAQKGE